MDRTNFFGRPVISGKSSYQIDICEVCLQKSVSWLEIMGSTEEGHIFRFTCDLCHEEFEQEPMNEELYARELQDVNEMEGNVIRNGWVNEFIESSSTIESIGEMNQEQPISENDNWSKDFIDEALFGSDPIQWLLDRNLINSDNSLSTIQILSFMSDNELPSVKLAVIQSLTAIFDRNPQFKNEILNTLKLMENDQNEIVASFCKEKIHHLDK
ncbi:MAG: hypothetical protein INQ03_07065 [Candidatus Heimdallarchaeota archaeon]|nr:hypothetical protein [Candidatus Heimdallarchaeota archaeon]